MKHKKIQNSNVTATCPKTSKVKTFLNIRSVVLVNVGLFESNNEGGISLKIGKRIPVNVGKQHTAEEVLETALKTHSDNEQFLCSLDDYILCYPGQKIVEFIPGTTESFTVEKYKEGFLSKLYSKMDLFWCNISVCYNMMLVAITVRRKKKMIYWITADMLLNLEFLIPLYYYQETFFLVDLLPLLVY